MGGRDVQLAKRYTEEPGPPTWLICLQAVNELMNTHGYNFLETTADAICVYVDLVDLTNIHM